MLAGVAIIVVAAFIAYLPSLNGGFIWDDNPLLANNLIIKASDGLYRIWCTTKTIDYWPVTNTSFWIEWRLWGMNSTGYHVTNLILHTLEALLIWVILRKLSIPGAFFAALIFAVHPVNVESVAWIAQRKSLLAMLFFLLSILCYLTHFSVSCNDNAQGSRRTPCAGPAHGVSGLLTGRWYWLSLAAFVLAMLSKGSVAVLPVLLLGIVWWLRPLTRRDLVRIAPFFLVAGVLAGVNVWFQTRGTGYVIRSADFTERLLGAGSVVWFYLYKALLPLGLVFVYPRWHIQAENVLWWLPLIAVLAVTAILWCYRKRWSRPLMFAWGFFCVALAPVMGFTDVYYMKYTLVADHYQHVALIGVIALAAAGWSRWHQQAQGPARWTARATAVAAAGVLTLFTCQQSMLYRGEITLFQATLGKNPDCWLAHTNLGLTLFDAGRLPEAIEHFHQALRLEPNDAKVHNNLAVALAQAGRAQEAIEHYQQALHINPNYPEAHNNLGALLADKGRTEEAIEHYRQALRFKPNYPEAHNNLGDALIKTGSPREASEHYRQALRLKPDSAETYYNLALAYVEMHRSAEAIAAAQQAWELARSKGQTALAKEIEDRLNSYRASLSK